MKKFTYFLSHVALFATVAMMVACGNDPVTNEPDPTPKPEPEPEPPVELTVSMVAELVEAGTTTAQIKLTTENIQIWSYSVETDPNADIAADLIYAAGTQGDCVDGDNYIDIEGLAPDTNYTVHFAGATVEDEIYEQVAKVSFKTGMFSEELTFYDIDYMSVSAHFNFPDSKVQKGNVLKWGLSMFPLYYSNQLEKGFTDMEMLNQHDTYYSELIIRDDTTWVFNEENSIGNSPEGATTLYEPIVPGQPMYLMIGEYAYSNEDHWGWGPGYYVPLYDTDNFLKDFAQTGSFKNQEQYWYGYFRKEEVVSKKPSRMSAKPTITKNLTPMGGTITITPTDEIPVFCVGLLDNSTQMDLLALLNNKSEYLQWYMTSFHAYALGIAGSYNGKTTIRLEDDYVMQQGKTYTLFVVALGDEIGSRQSMIKETFTLPKPTKPAPTAEVTGVESPTGKTESNEVWFNLKCTSGNAVAAKYIANYERDWASMQNQYIKAGYTEQEAASMIIDQYGARMTDEEVAAINSQDGYTIVFYSRPDANNICGISVMNDEGTWGSAIAAHRSPKEEPAPRVESSLFEELKGEWTATTTIRYSHYHFCDTPEDENHRHSDDCANNNTGKEYNDNNYIVTIDKPISSKVVIGDIGYEETLPEHVYQLFFEGSSLKTKEEVDAVYEQFKGFVDEFNANNRNQNRILCQGFELEFDSDKITCDIPEHSKQDKGDGVIPSKYASAYDLFIADAQTYSAFNYESPIFDFGPKWYLEIATDGTVTAPFNTQYFSPMAQWYKNVYQFVGASNNVVLPHMPKMVNGHFPVEVSADKNTITINPIKDYTYSYTDDQKQEQTRTEDFYPQIARDYRGQYQFYSRIIAPIVLTRNGSAAATAAAKALKEAKSTVVPTESGELKSIYDYKPAKIYKSHTALPVVEGMQPNKVVDYRVISSEQFKARSLELAEKRFGRK